MFAQATHEGGPATATRSRRRQRPLSNESIAQQPKAKRQRRPLTEDTFVAPDGPPEMFEVKPAAAVPVLEEPRVDSVNDSTPARRELSVRSKKAKAGDRASKGDGSVVLTTNNTYTVSKLPALPDRLRTDPSARQHGAVYPAHGFAVTMTHTHAIVWPYTSTVPSPETFTFTLPYPAKHASDPLPLASLVSPSASSSDPGLVVVMPVSGKITYWESISSAATLDLIRQQRNGVEESIPGMFAGETVIQLLNAESAGFIMAFSSGRVAYLSVRDGHGRPSISVQFLRGAFGGTSGGIFGSIRHALTNSAARGEIAAVHADRTSRVGERTVVAGTVKGKLHCWRIHRGGHHESLAEAEVREVAISHMVSVDPNVRAYAADSFELIDFTFVPRGEGDLDMSRLEETSEEDDKEAHLLLLVSLTNRKASYYSLVEVKIFANSLKVGMVRPLTSYKTPVSQLALERPRLYLPKPLLVAFAIFDRAVVVASIARAAESPELQLQEDSHILPSSFEDVIDFREDPNLEMVGSGFEEPQTTSQALEEVKPHRHKAKNPAAVLMVRGVGMIRISTNDVQRLADERPPQLTAKSKLEQAVFFGTQDHNPLVFEGRRELPFTSGEIEEAALKLSYEILSSSTPYLPAVPASLDANLQTRVRALRKLAEVLKTLDTNLDRVTRWRLLWDFEKMSIAASIWKLYEGQLADRPDSNKKGLVPEIVEFIHDDHKKMPNPAIGETDRVRHWFVHDVWRLEFFVAWAYEAIKYIYKDKLQDDAGVARLIIEAIEINMAAMSGAWEIRKKSLPLYGLATEPINADGVLTTGYEGLPQPWTSTNFITNNSKRLVELATVFVKKYWRKKSNADGTPDQMRIERMREDLPRLTDQYLVALQEHSRWAKTSGNPKTNEFGEMCAKSYLEHRYEKIVELVTFELWGEAQALAEKHHTLEALAEISIAQIIHFKSLMENSSAPERDFAAVRVQTLERQIGDYFGQYGEDFAFPAYAVLMNIDGVEAVLNFAPDTKGYATKYLRNKPELAKVSWINDVEREHDVDHAADTLCDLAINHEQHVWNKKIELSLGKLAMLAGVSESTNGDSVMSGNFPERESPRSYAFEGRKRYELSKVDAELQIIKIQDQLYNVILPTIVNAIDETAEFELAVATHGAKIPKKSKAFVQIYEDAMGRLLRHEALDPYSLIDLLTLSYLSNEAMDELSDPFFLALTVAEAAFEGEERMNAYRLIWRRCWIRDDWASINNTGLKSDEAIQGVLSETAPYSCIEACYDDYRRSTDPYNYLKPHETLGAYSSDLGPRFASADTAFRQRVHESMHAEDAVLRRHLEQHRLEDWAAAVRTRAEAFVNAVYDDVTENGAAARPLLRTGQRKSNGSSNGNGVHHRSGTNGVAH